MRPSTHFELRVPKKLVFSVFTLAMLGTILEVGQRISDARKLSHRQEAWDLPRLETSTGTPLGAGGPGRVAWTLDPHLIYVNKPHQTNPAGTINAQGFRGKDWSRKAPGRKRVFVVGGSVAYGWGSLSDAATIPPKLEKELERLAPGRFEVLNAGVIGYDSMQELVLVETTLLDWEPDVVVLLDGWNDLYNAGRTPHDRVPHQYTFDEVEELLRRGRDTGLNVLRESAFVRSLESTVRERQRARVNDAVHDVGSFFVGSKGVDRYRRDLELMCAIGRARGFATVLAPQPEITLAKRPVDPRRGDYAERSLGRGYLEFARRTYPAYVRAAQETARAQGAPFAECVSTFDAIDDEVFLDMVHLTERGNELVARRLAPFVIEAAGKPPN